MASMGTTENNGKSNYQLKKQNDNLNEFLENDNLTEIERNTAAYKRSQQKI